MAGRAQPRWSAGVRARAIASSRRGGWGRVQRPRRRPRAGAYAVRTRAVTGLLSFRRCRRLPLSMAGARSVQPLARGAGPQAWRPGLVSRLEVLGGTAFSRVQVLGAHEPTRQRADRERCQRPADRRVLGDTIWSCSVVRRTSVAPRPPSRSVKNASSAGQGHQADERLDEAKCA